MASLSYRYVILGGGNAAGYAARAFVAKNGNGKDLCIVSSEKALPYERPALSKGFLAPQNPARLPGFHTCVGGGGERQDEAWYSQHGIQFLGGNAVVEADLNAKSLRTADGKTISFEKLIIATGARPRTLDDAGIAANGVGNVYYVREVEEALQMYESMSQNSGKNAVVVGAGYIGIEIAAALVKHGIKVTMVYPSKNFLPRLFNASIASFYEEYYKSKGVSLMPERRVVEVKGDSCVEKVILDDGSELDASMVVVGIGSKSNSELFLNQLATSNGAIEVNEFLETTCNDVYAIGDIASLKYKISENDESLREGRFEHVGNARKTAAHVMDSILGSKSPYEYMPYFYSRIFDLSWKFFGGKSDECIHYYHEKDGMKFPGAFWLKENRICGGFIESGSDDQNTNLERIVKQRVTVEDKEELKKAGAQFLGRL